MTITTPYHIVRLIIFTGILATGLSACTRQSWYQGAQSSRDANCMKGPISEYEDCIQQSNESYDEYQKQRDELTTDSPTY